MSSENFEFWREFLNMYKSLPELWHIKNVRYKNKYLKNQAYQKLVNKLLEIDSTATVDSVKRKINAFKTNYRRELKKVLRNERAGINSPEMKSSLWYYEDLDFLRNQMLHVTDAGQTDGANDKNINNNDGLASTSYKTNLKRDGKELLEMTLGHFQMPIEEENDSGNAPEEYDDIRPSSVAAVELDIVDAKKDDACVLCACWASMYSKLSSKQQLYANKCIIEVLFMGQLGRLTENTHKSLEIPLQPQSSYTPPNIDNYSTPLSMPTPASKSLEIPLQPQSSYTPPNIDNYSTPLSMPTPAKQLKL